MLPNRWDPLRELTGMQREFDDVLRRMFGQSRETGKEIFTATPVLNTFVKDNIFHIEAELPGVDTENLDVRIDGSDLVIRGERRSGKETEGADYLLHEARYASFERRLGLPDGIDMDKAHASYKDGLLELTMPLLESKALGGRKIHVEGLDVGKKSKEIH